MTNKLPARIGYIFSQKGDFNRALKSMLKKKKNLLDLVQGHSQSSLFEDHFQERQTQLCSICYKFSMLLDGAGVADAKDWAKECKSGNQKVYFEKCGHVIHENCCEVLKDSCRKMVRFGEEMKKVCTICVLRKCLEWKGRKGKARVNY